MMMSDMSVWLLFVVLLHDMESTPDAVEDGRHASPEMEKRRRIALRILMNERLAILLPSARKKHVLPVICHPIQIDSLPQRHDVSMSIWLLFVVLLHNMASTPDAVEYRRHASPEMEKRR